MTDSDSTTSARYGEAGNTVQLPSYEIAVQTHNLPPICALCAGLLESPHDGLNEKLPLPSSCQWNCCYRFVCGKCIQKTPRLASYCPLCQISVQPKQTISFRKLPPSYEEESTSAAVVALAEKPGIEMSSAGDVVHYVTPEDTVEGLCLTYGVPMSIFQQHNRLFSNNLLAARRTVLIPPGYYAGPSKSPGPERAEEEQRKVQVKRFQLTTKCVEYKVAEWYLREAQWSLEGALMRWADDDEWEREAIRRKRMGSGARGWTRISGGSGRR